MIRNSGQVREVPAVENLLTLFGERVQTVKPAIRFRLGMFVMSIESPVPRKVAEEVWEIKELQVFIRLSCPAARDYRELCQSLLMYYSCHCRE